MDSLNLQGSTQSHNFRLRTVLPFANPGSRQLQKNLIKESSQLESDVCSVVPSLERELKLCKPPPQLSPLITLPPLPRPFRALPNLIFCSVGCLDSGAGRGTIQLTKFESSYTKLKALTVKQINLIHSWIWAKKKKSPRLYPQIHLFPSTPSHPRQGLLQVRDPSTLTGAQKS